MTPERWERIGQLFQEAQERSQAERGEFLRMACHGDDELRREVESLLEHDHSKPGVLEAVAQAAGGALEFRLPERLGKYRIIRLLGEGGMGAVYEAEQEHPRRSVALKVTRPGLALPGMARRFEQEWQALGRVQHPGIAQIFEAGCAETPFGPQPYFSMELIRGLPLLDYAATHGLAVRQRLELVVRICDAVQHAHLRGVIHRDLKPANILVDESGQPKILDFGVARFMDTRSAETRNTVVGEMLGTLAYMSPEQVMADPEGVDARTDVYALGVILYELLAGRLPYDTGRDTLETARTIREEAPRRLGMVNRACRGDLETIVHKALQKDKDRRYGSAQWLSTDLRYYLDSRPILARPPSAGYQLQRLAGRHRQLAGMVCAVVLALVGGVVASTWQAIRANRERARADEQAAIARAVSDFLQNDLLSEASARTARSRERPDPDLKLRTALDRAAARIGGKFESQPVVEAAIRQTIGNVYADLVLSAQAQPHLERALELRRHVLGPEHPDTLASMSSLATLYNQLGKYEMAEGVLEKLLPARQRLLGNDHPDTIEALTQLAVLARLGRGDHARAEGLSKQVLESAQRRLGERHPDTLTAMNNLAVHYSDQGKLEPAAELYEKALRMRKEVLGPDDPTTLAVMNNLGVVYRKQGKYAPAERLLEAALEGRRRIWGGEHRDTLVSRNSLAMLYVAQSLYGKAEPLLTHVVESRRRIQGEDSPETLNSMESLADCYQRQTKYSQAEPLLREVLKGRRALLAPDHPKITGVLVSLGGIKVEQRQYQEAERLLREALHGDRAKRPDSWDGITPRLCWGRLWPD